jgi:UDP:flavonoid glycosyltransferase YjiC (YdhE family)
MRLLFVSAQLPGHLDWGGYLPTAIELAGRGHELLWASGEAVAGLVTAHGLPFHALAETGWRWPPPPPLSPSPGLDEGEFHQLRAERALDQWLDVERVRRATDELIRLGQQFQPDLVVSENFAVIGGLAAEALAVPFVVAGWPALAPKVAAGDDALVRAARDRLQQLLDHFGLQGANWTEQGPPALRSPHLHLTYWSPRWYNGLALLPQTECVGGVAASPRGPAPPWPDRDPWVLITLGTSFGNDLNFFLNAAHAADQMGCLPILALGGQLPAAQRSELRSRLPRQAVLVEFVDFGAVLPHMAAAIHHGGAGVTHALVTHAVPQLIVPHAADQMHQAQGVVRSGVGLHIPAKEATVERLIAGLAQVLPDLATARSNAQLLRDEFAQLGGVLRASDLLEQFAAT